MIFHEFLSRAMVDYLTGTVSHYQRRIPNDLGGSRPACARIKCCWWRATGA